MRLEWMLVGVRMEGGWVKRMDVVSEIFEYI
jgi:hypothetical protein